MGRLEEIDAARIQILRSLADAVDSKPHSPQMWREYRDALEELIEGGDPEDLPDLLAELRADGSDTQA